MDFNEGSRRGRAEGNRYRWCALRISMIVKFKMITITRYVTELLGFVSGNILEYIAQGMFFIIIIIICF